MSVAARWKLERGAEVGLLETLMGSRTVGSTVITVAQLRLFNLGALGLLALWAISPLGGQAFLRIIRVEPEVDAVPASVTYYNNAAGSKINWLFFNAEDTYRSHESLMWTIYRALIIGPLAAKAAPMDLWGNVKIPLLQRDYDEGAATDEWDPIRENGVEGASRVPYASLLGVPFNLPATSSYPSGNVSFLLESSYVDLRCPKVESGLGSPNWTHEFQSYVEPSATARNLTNGTFWVPCLREGYQRFELPYCEKINALWGIALNRFVNSTWTRGFQKHLYSPALFEDEDGIEAGETTLNFVSRHLSISESAPLRPEWTEAECKVVQRYVESRVNCTRQEREASSSNSASPEDVTANAADCRVVAQRPSQKKHASENISFLSFQDLFAVVARLMPSVGMDTNVYSDIPVGYLASPDKLVQPEHGASLFNVTTLEFSRRLTQLVNTFVGTTQLVLNATLGSVPADLLASETMVTDTETRRFVEYVHVSRLWVILGLAASLVLLVCGVLSVVFRNLAKSPEVLGYVSSSIRESKFAHIPAETRYLDGLDLTTAIRKDRVIWGPVQNSWNGEQEPLMGIVRQEEVRRGGAGKRENASRGGEVY